MCPRAASGVSRRARDSRDEIYVILRENILWESARAENISLAATGVPAAPRREGGERVTRIPAGKN